MTGEGRRPDRVPRLRDVTHVREDHDPRAWHWFARGPTVAADGGERPGRSRASSDVPSDGRERPRNVEEERIRDVSHQPASGDGANRVWERGEGDSDGARG